MFGSRMATVFVSYDPAGALLLLLSQDSHVGHPQGAVKLSSQQSSLVIAALIRLQSELGLLEGQRREAAAALSTAYMDNFGGKIKLTALFMQHHQALGQVDAICSQEQELFLQFMDDFYDVRASLPVDRSSMNFLLLIRIQDV